MRISHILAAAVATVMLGAASPSFADNMQGGNGSTGNPGTNDPAANTPGMMNMKAMPRCTTKRTHNCRHASTTKHMTKSM